MVLLMRISFFRLPVTCCQDEEISPVVFLLACFPSRCASRGPIPVEDETIERTTSVGKRIEEHQPGSALRWPEPEQEIQHQQVDGGIHTANQSETHELPDGPASCFSCGGGMHLGLVRFARQRCGRWEF